MNIRGIPSLFNQAQTLAFFHSSMLWITMKKGFRQFSDFFENFSGSNGRYLRGMRAFIDSLEIWTINSLMKNEIFQTYFIMSRVLFWVTPSKRKKIEIILLPTSLKWQHSLHANFFQSFFLKFYFQFFSKILFSEFFSKILLSKFFSKILFSQFLILK